MINQTVSESLRSLREMYLLSLQELCNITPLAGLGLLHKVGGTVFRSSPPSVTTVQFAMLELVDNVLLDIELDQNYTSFVVSTLFHKPRGWEGALFRGEENILNFGR